MVNFRVIFAAFIFVLISCISVEEELEVKPDGSGKGKITYIMPTSFYKGGQGVQINEETIKKSVEKMKGVHLEKVRTEIGENDVKVIAKFKFDHVKNLSQRGITYTLEDMGDMIEFRVVLQPAGGRAHQLVKKVLQGFISKLKVELPAKVIESNGKIEGRRKVTWNVPLSKIAGGKEATVLWARYSKKRSILDRILDLF